MSDRLLNIADAALRDIVEARNKLALSMRLSELALELGFDGFGVAKDIHLNTWDGTSEFTNWAQELSDTYVACEVAGRDPLIRAARMGSPHQFFAAPSTYASKQDEKFAMLLRDVGCQGGLLVSLYAPHSSCSVFCLTVRGKVPLEPGLVGVAKLVGSAALVRLGSLGDASEAPLSTLQTRIMGWVAQGKSNRDIASICGISERAVVYQLSQVFQHLNVATRTQAVRALLQAGKIDR